MNLVRVISSNYKCTVIITVYSSNYTSVLLLLSLDFLRSKPVRINHVNVIAQKGKNAHKNLK